MVLFIHRTVRLIILRVADLAPVRKYDARVAHFVHDTVSENPCCTDNLQQNRPPTVKGEYGLEGTFLSRKLRQLEIAGRLSDLRVPPGNRLEALKGDREGQHSIRVNDQFRLCFRWTDTGADDVEIVDYH